MPTLHAVAAEIGLDLERLKADMDDPVIQEAIDRNLALAQALRITGTPGFVVGRQILRGAVDLKTLQQVISNARAKQ
jgi:predicted DsbA family dithiol-disulfide isomerase